MKVNFNKNTMTTDEKPRAPLRTRTAATIKNLDTRSATMSSADNSVSLVADAAESLSTMIQKEQTIYKSCDYLRRRPPQDAAIAITASDRAKIVDWCYSVVDCGILDVDVGIVAVSMEVVDRFLSILSLSTKRGGRTAQNDPLQDREQFQLVAISALYTTIKANSTVAIGSDVFSALTPGLYNDSDIEDMEWRILNDLEWRITAPTSVQMVDCILTLILPNVHLQEASTWERILDEARHQLVHAVRDYYFVTQRPSTVALAAIFNALDGLVSQDRQAIIHALLLVMNDEFESCRGVVAAKKRLLFSMDSTHDCKIAGAENAASTVSHEDASTTFSLESMYPEKSYCDLTSSTVSASLISARSVGCCRRDNILCVDCLMGL